MWCLDLKCPHRLMLFTFYPPCCGAILKVAEHLGTGVWLQTESVGSREFYCTLCCSKFMGIIQNNKTWLLDWCHSLLNSLSPTVLVSHAINFSPLPPHCSLWQGSTGSTLLEPEIAVQMVIVSAACQLYVSCILLSISDVDSSLSHWIFLRVWWLT